MCSFVFSLCFFTERTTCNFPSFWPLHLPFIVLTSLRLCSFPIPPWTTSPGMPWVHLHSPHGPPSAHHFSLGLGSAPGGSSQETCGGVSVGPPLPMVAIVNPEGPRPCCTAPSLASGPRGASWCCARRCPSPPWWPCCACGSGSPCPSSTWATTSASASSPMTTLCEPTRFPGRSLSSGGT